MWHWLVILGVVAALLAIASLLAVAAWGRFARRARGVPSYALAPNTGERTPLDLEISARTEARPGETGLLLLESNLRAFAARGQLIRAAQRSLDLMYYIWKEDLTGGLLMAEVIAAADRGVRVRLLLDDIGVDADDRICLALNSHPQIELRLFNPTIARGGGIKRGLEMFLRLFSVTRRMHNKAMIADGRLVLLGGRNIADEYFDASQSSHFRDLDLVAMGPVVEASAQMFDSYWNSEVALPIRNLNSQTGEIRSLRSLRLRLKRRAEGAQALRYREALNELKALPGETENKIYWCEGAELIADPPAKALGRDGENWMMKALFPLLTGAKDRISITSPYFVPGASGCAQLSETAERGVEISVLTNSLAATDVAAVHGGYARYRKALLRAGVRLFELRPAPGRRRKRISFRGSRRASLHTKAFTLDGTTGFIGSLNFDPRSSSLNTEMGLLIYDTELVARMEEIFAEEITEDVSYTIGLTPAGRLTWQADGRMHRPEPGASPGRRLIAILVRWLPLESQL